MEKLWIKRDNSAELLLFFNGWGMDEKPFRCLDNCSGLDVLMLYDYTELEKLDIPSSYESIHLTAWSLGVFAAAEVLQGVELSSSVAVNGTLRPIDEGEGIAPAVFQATIDNWREAAAMKFNRRMCLGHYDFFKNNLPERSVESRKNELIALREQILNKPVPENIFREAVISLNDRIFTRHAQETHWRNARLPVRIIDEPHYFFPELKSWKDMLFR
ncbi:MAG: pimeloyl-ACP methyl esterase BioG family protein [Victivallales bacterium]